MREKIKRITMVPKFAKIHMNMSTITLCMCTYAPKTSQPFGTDFTKLRMGTILSVTVLCTLETGECTVVFCNAVERNSHTSFNHRLIRLEIVRNINTLLP